MESENNSLDKIRKSIDKLQSLSEVSGIYRSIQKLGKKDILSPTLLQEDLLEPPKLNFASFSLPEPKTSPVVEDLHKICEFNQRMADTNKELIAKLSAMEASHKYDWLKELIIAIVSGVAGSLITHFIIG